MTRGGWGFTGGWLLLTLAVPLLYYPDYAGFAEDWRYGAGRLCGLIGLAVCLAQPLGMSGIGMKLLGSSRMSLHKYGGLGGLGLLTLHPVLLAASEGDWGILLFQASPAVWLGKAAFALMLLAVGAFLLVKFKKIRFLIFSRIHNLAFIAALLGLIHAYFAGYSLRSAPVLLGYYLALAAAGLYFFTASKGKKMREYFAKRRAGKSAA